MQSRNFLKAIRTHCLWLREILLLMNKTLEWGEKEVFRFTVLIPVQSDFGVLFSQLPPHLYGPRLFLYL